MNARYLLGVARIARLPIGPVPRAPVWMRRTRLEWLWRLALEPRRMFGATFWATSPSCCARCAHRAIRAIT